VAGAALAGAAIAKGVGDALEREKLGDKTAASLGLSEKQSAKAGSVAGQLYAGAWGESMPDVTNAVESVISSIDGMAKASPKRLHDVTAGVLDMATAFEIDASDAATNVGILIKQGLVKDAEEGTDLITAALQRVPKTLRGDVMDATQEYSQFFADVGYTGSEAMGLLVAGAEDGTYGVDKMGDAIKEFTIRGTDMSKST
jgi:phage-related minor tail protein